MYFKSRKEWLKANTKSAYKIIKKLEKEDRREVKLVLDWLCSEVERHSKYTKYYEDAINRICDKETVTEINRLVFEAIRDDALENNKWLRKLEAMRLVEEDEDDENT